jgi:hypothetical protein
MQPFSRGSFLSSSLFIALILGGSACSNAVPVAQEPHPPRLPAAANFGSAIFRIGKPVLFSDGLTVELKGINDSRCPAKVQCIWQGELAANLIARGGDLGPGETPVMLGTVTAGHRALAGYDFVLSDASPTTATVIVTKPGVGPNGTASSSVVQGTVTVGPSCPVERMPPDPNCADRPAAATFAIDTPAGVHVADASSGPDGKFSLTLPAGTYVISLKATAAMPSMAAQTFVVGGNGPTELSLQLDSGIR